jgi:hypothetical protein
LVTKRYVDQATGSGSGVSDHGALTGLTDDDHPQYVLTDGSRGFTSTVSGVYPVEEYHLATKYFVDASFEAFDPTASGAVGNILFGGKFNYVIDEALSSTNSTSYQNKISLSTGDVPEGDYRIGWHFEWRISKQNGSFYYRIQLDNTTDIDTGNNSPYNDVNIWNPVTNFYYVETLSSGSHTFDLDWRSSAGNSTAYIRAARFEFWRVS